MMSADELGLDRRHSRPRSAPASFLPCFRCCNAMRMAKPNARSSHRKATPQGGGHCSHRRGRCGSRRRYRTRAPATPRSIRPRCGSFLPRPLSSPSSAPSTTSGPSRSRRVSLLQALAVAIVIASLPSELRVVPGLPWWVERARSPARLPVVRQSHEFHGRHRLDDRRRVRSDGCRPCADRHCSARCRCTASSWPWRFAAGCSALRPSTGRSHASFSATSAVCRSACCSAGCCCSLRATAISPRPSSCRFTIWRMRRITLLRRLANGEKVWQAHRTHFYQRATDRGWSVPEIVTHVFAVNGRARRARLCQRAVAGRPQRGPCACFGVAIVAWLLHQFVTGKRTGTP